jgi:hypothetical protein
MFCSLLMLTLWHGTSVFMSCELPYTMKHRNQLRTGKTLLPRNATPEQRAMLTGTRVTCCQPYRCQHLICRLLGVARGLLLLEWPGQILGT